MADPVIRLDKSRPFGTCHGERMPDDPLYKVCYWQGGKLNGKQVQLPFDVHGELIADDGKTESFTGMGQDSRGNTIQVQYSPLYTPLMRAFLDTKRAHMQRATQSAAPVAGNAFEEDGVSRDDGTDLGTESSPIDGVDFGAWLRGEINYAPHLLREAAFKRFHVRYPDIYPQLVVDCVFDHKVVSEGEVCGRFLPMIKRAIVADTSINEAAARASAA